MSEEINLLGHPSLDDKRAFEHWYTTHAFDYVRHPVGSRECLLQRKAWIAAPGGEITDEMVERAIKRIDFTNPESRLNMRAALVAALVTA